MSGFNGNISPRAAPTPDLIPAEISRKLNDHIRAMLANIPLQQRKTAGSEVGDDIVVKHVTVGN